ncbi:MAG: hypothetical protein Q9227_002847 [Pyrenula ochraceoflavens]
MPRPPIPRFRIDRTHFTSAGPFAVSYASFSQGRRLLYKNPAAPKTADPPSTRPLPSSRSAQATPPGETPKEKVERLRAEHRRRIAAQYSPLERFIDRGRVWADNAHFIFVTFLILFSGNLLPILPTPYFPYLPQLASTNTFPPPIAVSIVFAAYSFFDLVRHNRKQKRAWIEAELERLHQARMAFLAGTADAEQLHILEQEQAGEEMKRQHEEEQRIRKEQSLFTKLKRVFVPESRSMGAEDDAERARRRREEEGGEEGEMQPRQILAQLQALREAKEKVAEEAGGEDARRGRGAEKGQLDALASNVAGAVSSSSDQGWFSWLKWR